MFTGNYNHTLDSKSRVSIPSGFRDFMLRQYNSRVTLTQHSLNKSIILWPDPVYEKFIEKILALPEGDEEVEQLRWTFLAQAFQVEFDANGRIFVSQTLRVHAGLQRDVVIAGMGRNIQIWARDKWDDLRRSRESDPDGLKRIMKKFNISF